MSDNNNLYNFLTPASYSGSANAGAWEAKSGYTLSRSKATSLRRYLRAAGERDTITANQNK